MSNGGPRAVLWDMDGTLLDSEKLWDVSLEALAQHLGGHLSHQGREAMVGSNMAQSLPILFNDLGLEFTPDDLTAAGQWLRMKTAELFDAGLEWRPGAQAALDMVAAAGMPMALVTNTERFLTERALGTLGRDRFTAIICGDEVTRGKPDPEPYAKAAAELGFAPGDCLAIEDSPTGTAAADAAGCSVLVVPCEVAVPEGRRRTQRVSLDGLTAEHLHDYWFRGQN
ncbi:HAD family phosphatase [Hoyosella rhizosphaerae]|uniref:Phosphoglycolate phosphatase n=1 Tax=Hoyosella rhizosphaerae TaxID=1755582 RepID=A0A916U2R6_9ACTN|nr:HAD family phosphatase [Hoyosella rhizosphaerae]MBN4926557.1 HAD family phosphatase [Hoyosella rhizosphaerae]GGC58310.1 phosphoglycolate phosphatase [Hoyosella rhizosphaerae]